LGKAEVAYDLLKNSPRTHSSAELNGQAALKLIGESVEVLPEPGMYFSTDLGETLENDVDSTLGELFPQDP